MTLLNIFHSGGLWVIPVFIFGFAIVFVISGILSAKSGSVTGGSSNDPTIHESDENVSFFSTWQFKFGVVLIIAATIILAVIAADYKGV